MKEKIKRISSSTWALLLALMMVVSSFSVLAATTNVEKTGTISYWVLRGDFNSWSTDTQYQFGGADGGSITYDLSSKKGSTIKFRTDAYENGKIHFNSSKGTVTDNTEVQLKWGTGDVMYYTVPSDSNGKITFKVTVSGGNNYLTVTAGSGGSTTTDLYLCGYINNAKVDHANASYKLTQSDDKYTGTFTFSTDTQYVTISNGTKAYVASKNNAMNGDKANSNSPTSGDSNPDDKWEVDTSSSKTITFTWDDINKTLSWVSGSVEPTETTTTTPTPSGNYYLIGELSYGGTQWDVTKAAIISENKFTDVDGKYVSRELTYSSEKWFKIYDGKNELGCTSDTTIPSQKDTNIKLVSEGIGGSLKIAGLTNGQKYKIYIQDECIWYELAEDPVATSVTISADATFKSVGDSVNLTAKVTDAKSNNLTYTFTEVNENGTPVGTPQKLSTNTATFTNLTQGTHYYKVTVSANGYSSVTNETNAEVTVTEVVVKREMNAKYQISDTGTGSSFQDAKADKTIATVNDDLTATGSTGSVKAVNSFETNGNTYVFSKWFSKSGTFANATSKETTFSPTSDGDVIAQYKRQYRVTCTTPTNGTLTPSATGPLAGDSYTITVKPDDGYELASLTVYLGDTATYGENVTSGVVNGTYTMKTAVNNARYVATFTKKKVDYSKYKLIGHFDSNNTWEYKDGLTFNENGECTFTLEGTSSGGEGGNGQFRFSDGTNDYGATTNTDLQMNTEYTPEKGKKFIYYLFTAGAGTYKVTITKIAPNGTPSFKVTKDSTKSKYKLMSSTSQNTAGSSVGDFKTTDDEKVMSMTLSLAEGTYNFYVNDGSKNYCATMNGTLGQAHRLYRKDNDEVGCVQYKLSAGLYTATYTIDSDNSGTLKIDSVAKPLAESVTLSAAQTSVTAGKSTTITATLNNSAVPTGNTYTYKYYDNKGNILATKESQSTSDSITVTSGEVGTVTYYVTVSTNATYKDPNYEESTLSYSDVSSEATSVSYVAKSYYIAEVNDTTVGDRHALTQESFKPKSSPVTLSFFNDELAISEDTVEVMTVDESKNKYCQIITSNIEDSAVSTGIPTYKVICNEGAKNPVVYVNNGHIYAVASLDTDATSKTFESNETVTYYFAEPTWNTTTSNPSNGKAGLRIKYWNT
mgnify:CR=1 FL=1